MRISSDNFRLSSAAKFVMIYITVFLKNKKQLNKTARDRVRL